MARPGRDRIVFDDKMISELERMAGQGLSEDQIGLRIGVSPATIQRRKREKREFDALTGDEKKESQAAKLWGCSVAEAKRRIADLDKFDRALKKGKAKGVDLVTNALFNNAVSGNIAAQIFFLKNRDSENWKDKIEQDNNHEGEIRIVYDDIDKKA